MNIIEKKTGKKYESTHFSNPVIRAKAEMKRGPVGERLEKQKSSFFPTSSIYRYSSPLLGET
jgi:hypothetical protein